MNAAASRNLPRSILAVFAGFFAGAALSLGTDQILHMLSVYPPWGEPMHAVGLNALALSYRLIYDTVGSLVTARLAPRNAMRHALVGGVIGTIVCLLGIAASVQHPELGPLWYPVALALSVMPTAWLGGRLAQKR